ncbi:MAG: sigma-70 family RNA polymerase sigma factor [Candidatus Latescibacterota bacterium]|nr:MAG: sigma-70 family RNA polymerase sigma factor [Candidatus Latescibacterota bacterium]
MNTNDRELVSRAQEGEASAFEELVYRYDRKVLGIARSFTNDPDDAQDIYQEVFLRVYRALPGFRFKSEFSTWLYRIVMNVCLSHKTRSASRAHTTLDATVEPKLDDSGEGRTSIARPPAPDRAAQNAEIRASINAAVDTLAPRERLAFTLKHFEGYKIREIAEMMECREGTAKRYIFTAVGKLRKKLKKLV